MTARGKQVKRGYESPYRTEMAAQTRLRVLRAAIELFSDKGFEATTVDDVAEAAGVSRPTVFAAVGSKAQLIKEARDVALVGDDEPVPMPERPWVQALRAEPDAGKALRIYAGAMAAVHSRAARLELAIASAGDAEVKALAVTAREQRHFGCNLITGLVARKRRFRSGLKREVAADLVFALASPEVFDLLVSTRGWTVRQYESWLAETLESQFYGWSSKAGSSQT